MSGGEKDGRVWGWCEACPGATKDENGNGRWYWARMRAVGEEIDSNKRRKRSSTVKSIANLLDTGETHEDRALLLLPMQRHD